MADRSKELPGYVPGRARQQRAEKAQALGGQIFIIR